VLSINLTGTQKEYPEVYCSYPQYPQANLEIVPSISMVLTIHILLAAGCERAGFIPPLLCAYKACHGLTFTFTFN